jgi:glutathione S-transferase
LARDRAGQAPILWLDGNAVSDSTRIIAALKRRFLVPALYPRDAVARQRALALEDDLDETIGPPVRAAIMSSLFRQDPDIALRVLTTGMPHEAKRRLRPLLLAIFPTCYRFRHKINDATWRRIVPPLRQRWTGSSSSGKVVNISSA